MQDIPAGGSINAPPLNSLAIENDERNIYIYIYI